MFFVSLAVFANLSFGIEVSDCFSDCDDFANRHSSEWETNHEDRFNLFSICYDANCGGSSGIFEQDE